MAKSELKYWTLEDLDSLELGGVLGDETDGGSNVYLI